MVDLKDISQEDLKKLQNRLLELVVYFRDFCNEHNLKFTLAAGTCLGAVRHHGFIPWDDDLDVQMPREDYEKLPMLWEKYADKSRFTLWRTTKDLCVKFPMTVIKSENTTCIYDHSKDLDISQGIKIDVEFLDGVPNNKIVRRFNYCCGKLIALYRTQRIPNQTNLTVKIFSAILLGLVPTHKLRWSLSCILEKQIMKYKIKDCEYVRYLARDIRKKSCIEDIIWVDFEGESMPIPQDYDSYLRLRFGDYMKLPDEKNRYPKTHNLIYFDVDKSYKEFKGQYYCVND